MLYLLHSHANFEVRSYAFGVFKQETNIKINENRTLQTIMIMIISVTIIERLS